MRDMHGWVYLSRDAVLHAADLDADRMDLPALQYRPCALGEPMPLQQRIALGADVERRRAD